MASLLTPTLSTSLFTWNLQTKTFVAEASDFKGFRPGPAYDDAADEGFTLVNEKSGCEVRLVETHEEYRDGELLWWEYEPIDPRYKGAFKVKVFND